jgi:hypothetical protein
MGAQQCIKKLPLKLSIGRQLLKLFDVWIVFSVKNFYALRLRCLPMSRMQWWIRPGPRRPCTNKAIFQI